MMVTSGTTHTQNSGFKVINFESLITLAGKPADLTKYDTNPRDAKAKCAWFLPSDIGTSKKNQIARLTTTIPRWLSILMMATGSYLTLRKISAFWV